MSIDFPTVLSILEPVALAVASVTMPVVPVLIGRAIGVAVTTQQAAAVAQATMTAANGMYTYFVRNKASPHDPNAWEAAVDDAVTHVQTIVPNAVTSTGTSSEQLRTMVVKNFGAVLAADPKVSVFDPSKGPTADALLAAPTSNDTVGPLVPRVVQ